MVGDASSFDSGSDDFGSCDPDPCFCSVGGFLSGVFASGSGVVLGAAAVWCVETPGSMGSFSDRAARPLLCARGLTIPDRPAQSTAKTLTATTVTTPVRTGRRGR